MSKVHYVVTVEGVSWVTDHYVIAKATDRSNRYPWIVLGNFMQEEVIYDSDKAAKTFCKDLEFRQTISVEPLDPGSVLEAAYIQARVFREVQSTADKLKGVAEKFFNEHLPPEVKAILRNAPAAADIAGEVLLKGVSTVIDALKKDK